MKTIEVQLPVVARLSDRLETVLFAATTSVVAGGMVVVLVRLATGLA